MKIWQHILSKLQDNQKVYLLTVVQNQGSSPGRQGFKMMVAQDGTIFGSIGGGVMEYKLVEKAKKRLLTNKLSSLLTKQIHQAKTPNSSGMICSGEQTVVFSALSGKNITPIQKILQEKKDVVLLLSVKNVSFSFDSTLKNPVFQYQDQKNWLYKEPLHNKKTVYIVGSGHVGLATSEILKFLNYNVIVLDNRKNLNTFNQNNFALKKEIINYHTIQEHIPNQPNSIVIIMTNKYTDDKLILEKLLIKKQIKYSYIGVLGSKAKIQTMFKALQENDINSELLKQVHAPIGISIKSQTPQEIAVSIAAELIALKKQ